MRGWDNRRDGLFSYVRPESRIPSNHPLRLIRGFADDALTALNDQFAALYSDRASADGEPQRLVVDACLTRASGTAEPEAALAMLQALPDAGHRRWVPTRPMTPRPSLPIAAPR